MPVFPADSSESFKGAVNVRRFVLCGLGLPLLRWTPSSCLRPWQLVDLGVDHRVNLRLKQSSFFLGIPWDFLIFQISWDFLILGISWEAWSLSHFLYTFKLRSSGQLFYT